MYRRGTAHVERIGIDARSITVKGNESRMEGRLMSVAQLPLRLTTGAFVLNSGIGKLSLSDEDAEGLQQMAANGVPVLADMSPAAFRRFIAFTEIGVGAAQLIPKVPGWLAGSALSAFSAGWFGMERIFGWFAQHGLEYSRNDSGRRS